MQASKSSWKLATALGSSAEALRRIGLRFTQFATATCFPGSQGRPRWSLGARQAACPFQTDYHLAYLYLMRAAF
jgi:hypothetical protein